MPKYVHFGVREQKMTFYDETANPNWPQIRLLVTEETATRWKAIFSLWHQMQSEIDDAHADARLREIEDQQEEQEYIRCATHQAGG